jgi:hypothetical protein
LTPPRRLGHDPADEREARAVVGQVGGRDARVIHGQRLVDSAGKFGVGPVHADIMPLTHGMPVTLIKLQFDP